MKTGFYSKLAWEGIRKNRRLYFPYILIGAVMVMMFYILSFLSELPALEGMGGGSVLKELLPLGSAVISIFSLLFLFYTNSFLIRGRYREFGLYNVLGMDKRNIGKIMLRECLVVGVAATGSGLIAGIALSKAAELVLLNMLRLEVNYKLTVGLEALRQTLLVFGGIYFLLLINSLIRVKRAKPLELMKADSVGERLPKRIWVEAVIGVIFLGSAYYLAVSIEEPLAALAAFFIAVILVIGGTYELFMAGSVVFCKLLQRNKRYYYQPNHFISVSSMVYRMRRNGAGLASICILMTMVLVMIWATASLYFGTEDVMRTRFPRGVNITASFDSLEGISDESIEELKHMIREHCGEAVEPNELRAGRIPGLITEEGITIEYSPHINFSLSTYNNVGYLSVISLEDYNRMTGEKETLTEDECLLYCVHTEYTSDTFTMEKGRPYKVKRVLDEFVEDGEDNALIVPAVYLVVEDMEAFVAPVLGLKNSRGDSMMIFDWRYSFDLDTPEKEIASADAILEEFRNRGSGEGNSFYSYSVESREANRADFFLIYGGLFFLGIMLSIVFLLAAVLIIYYKQISEGYEDQARFGIMQKVGLTQKDIRRNINSQMLTVFFLPLIFAGIHLSFAFPFIWKILMLFNLRNVSLVLFVMVICFSLFGLFYTLVYRITSNVYYAIVSRQ